MSRFTGSKYTQRKDIAQEYIRCVFLLIVKYMSNLLSYNNYRLDRNDQRFLNEYPEALLGIRALLNAIYIKMEERGDLVRRKSKNGTPEERKQRNMHDSDSE